ncbi:dTDP-4-dehydrorhamnose 3,5-epimerase [Sphingomonas nostoxanthinifaciens]|uniref:dTDP-4-dehydrorhamnose 3,5-epimerase n=1 Tax=Sphingomonas nostoxanthinifaciens TaxID=2872652 RepID=UPI001CC1CD2E|nr:dTDP-4-dehydrorhamnose 3,5-epimerase [Sphingomonas nostoxanthinifaciens]UAK25011.1 dTDP-4-dehydrorhamnose 3,5-epimerase [Sphingomonas nostoxanthinifaciens]
MPVKLIRPRRFGDDRGWFMETYAAERYATLGIGVTFVQDNHSMSRDAGVLRGLHWQAPPFGQDKLVRCVAGAIWDVAVDARRGSPTFGTWVAAELSADNGHQLFIPIGFAHGFVTLQPDTQVEYKCSGLYAPQAEGGVIWSDPNLALPWPLDRRTPILSPKDEVLPMLDEATTPFTYDGRPLEPLDA